MVVAVEEEASMEVEEHSREREKEVLFKKVVSV